MVLDTTHDTVTWKYHGNPVSEIVTLPSDHIAIDLLEFPPGGWQNPHQSESALSYREPDAEITRADFETACAAVLLESNAPLVFLTSPRTLPLRFASGKLLFSTGNDTK